MTQYDLTAAFQPLVDACSRWITWENVKAFANSSFFTSLAGALAGAFAGAYAAQRVAERSKLRDELMRELRATNAALSVVFSVVSSLLSVKQQHIKSLRDSFVAQRTALEAHEQKRATGQVQGNALFEFQANLRSIPELTLPLETLRELAFGRLSVQGRALSLVAAVMESAPLLNGAIARRNALIEKFKSGIFEQGASLVTLYFGLPYDGGHVNQEYPDTVEAISNYADDVISYSRLLAEDLHAHGELQARGQPKRLARKLPKIARIDFQKAREDGLMPSDERYADWLKSFVKHEDASGKAGQPE